MDINRDILPRHNIPLFTFRNIPFDKVITDTDGSGFYPVETTADDRKRVRHIQEGIWLFLREYLLNPVVTSFPFSPVKGTPPLLQQFIHLSVFKKI